MSTEQKHDDVALRAQAKAAMSHGAAAAPAAAAKSAHDPTLSEKLTALALEAKHRVTDIVEQLAHLADPLTDEELHKLNAYWRASNYLTIGQIYLRGNPLLQTALKIEHVKPRLLGHWGTSPGLNMLYIHVNRVIKRTNDDFIFLAGPGHGGPAIVAQTYLEGTYSEVYPKIQQDVAGLTQLFRQFSAPGGIPSHVSPNVPGSIHEGGELGYVLTHAFGAVMDNPNLIALAVVGDGEAETGPLEGSWKSISFINPVHDGAVLPVLHLNGYKISSPTVLGRETNDNLRALFTGYGYEPLFVEGDDPAKVHQSLAKTLEYAVTRIHEIQNSARAAGHCNVRPRWPLLIFRTPKGWTGPVRVDNKQIEGTFRSHQVPLAEVREKPEHFAILEEWLRSYHAEELFDASGKFKAEFAELAPKGNKRMSAQPVTNAGGDLKPLVMPGVETYALQVTKPTQLAQSSVAQLGLLCRDLYKLNPHSFRLFCPDETNSNKLGAVFEVENRAFMQSVNSEDEKLAHSGRVMEVLSEHLCNGWLEGYVLTGRYGLLASYEAFSMIFNSMTLQMIKWFEVVSGTDEEGGLTWRKPVPSINILLTSTCWRNDHNGFSHQGPSFVDTLISKHGNVVSCYFPCDANTLLVAAQECLSSTNHINLIVQDKQVQLQYLGLEDARKHVKEGLGRWAFASNEGEQEPDIIIACCGDVMTQEALAATAFLREHAPDFRVRFVNVVRLMSLYQPRYHPHGVSQEKFESLFGKHTDVVFAYHAFPGSLHQLVHGRSDPQRFHVRGYNENGTTTTPFDMVVLNGVSRFHLVQVALRTTKRPPANAADMLAKVDDVLLRHRKYVVEEMEDMKEIREWKWNY